MNYYGMLDKDNFEKELSQYEIDYSSLTKEEIEIENIITFRVHESEIKYLLVDHGIFEEEYITDRGIEIQTKTLEPDTGLTFDDFETDISAPVRLGELVFSIIALIHKKEFLNYKLTFFDELNTATYGLSFEERKKIALQEFKRIYDSISINNEQKSFELKQRNKFKVITPTPFYNLYFFRKSIINRLNNHCYLPYLFGDIELYLKFPYNDTPLFKEIALFQINLEILMDLNDSYNFENDIYFNSIFFYRLKSITADSGFKNFQAFVFILYHLNTLSEITTTYTESTYSFLIQNDLYYGMKSEFLNLINKEFDTNFKKIREYDTNLEHKNRVVEITKEWNLFVEKYC